VSEDEPRRADEIRAPRLPGSQSDDPGSRIRQGHPGLHRRPPEDGRPLQAKEDQHPPEEALNGGAFAQLVGGPRGRQAIALLLALGISGDHRLRPEHLVDPGSELEPPIAGIQAHHPRAQREEPDGQCQEWPREGGIMDVGAREEKEQG
jgi:hypothetical protein